MLLSSYARCARWENAYAPLTILASRQCSSAYDINAYVVNGLSDGRFDRACKPSCNWVLITIDFFERFSRALFFFEERYSYSLGKENTSFLLFSGTRSEVDLLCDDFEGGIEKYSSGYIRNLFLLGMQQVIEPLLRTDRVPVSLRRHFS